MERQFVTKSGGNVIIEQTNMVSRRQWLEENPGLRGDLFRDNRRRILDQLEEKSGLPFPVAIQNIKGWKEEERASPRFPGDLWVGVDDNMRPVLLVTRVYVGHAEYRAE